MTTAEISSEPRQPRRLEKKKNMVPGSGRASVVDQRTDQREQSLVFGAAAACSQELSYVGS